jgi:3',5'-cyclic-AMP phosphodiesterase
MQDQDGMENGDAFLELLNKYPNVAHLFIGHVHRPISGQMAGLSFTTMRSVLYQAPAPVPAWDWDSFKPGQEAPAIGVVRVDRNSVIVQFEQFAEFDVGILV